MDILNKKIEIEIDTESNIFEYIQFYAASFEEIKNYTVSNLVKKNNKYEIEYKLPYGKSLVEYHNSTIKLYYEKDGSPVGLSYSVKIKENLKLIADSKEIIESFIFDAKKYSEPEKNNEIICRIWKNTYWSVMSKLPKRDINTLFLDGNKKEEIIEDINNFKNTKDDYINFGIPYKRNFMLEGQPGTGKTSLITTIASDLDLDIAIINFGPKLDDVNFISAISNLPDKSILILEDIDVLFNERRKAEGNNSFVSFSCILNVLDGMSRKEGLITFMTTNYLENLDSALIRPGRIDYKLNFDYATKNQIYNMYKYFLEDQIENFEKFYKKINKYKIVTSALQKFLFENRKCENILEPSIINKLIDIIDNKTKNDMFT